MQRDERVERARRYVSTETDSTVDGLENMLAELLIAYDDLAARREQDIREAVILERGSLQTTISLDERPEETGEDVSFNDGLHTAIDRITQRGPALDPATIRREERERIAAAARDTQRWVGGNWPAWAHEMFRQFAAAVENGEIDHPESKEEGS